MGPLDRKSQVALQEELIRLGEAAYDPELSPSDKEAGTAELKTFLERLVGSPHRRILCAKRPQDISLHTSSRPYWPDPDRQDETLAASLFCVRALSTSSTSKRCTEHH